MYYFVWPNIQNPDDIQFIITYDKKKMQILSFEMVEATIIIIVTNYFWLID